MDDSVNKQTSKQQQQQVNSLTELLASTPENPSNNTATAQNPFDDLNITPPGTNPNMQNHQPPPPGGPPHPGGPQAGGKVYPPNQQMVFNPSNPNAPPIYPCGICHKEVHDNDQAILCESGCNFWFHRICTGLTEPAFHMLTQEVYAEWVCDKCLSTKNIPLVKMKP